MKSRRQQSGFIDYVILLALCIATQYFIAETIDQRAEQIVEAQHVEEVQHEQPQTTD